MSSRCLVPAVSIALRWRRYKLPAAVPSSPPQKMRKRQEGNDPIIFSEMNLNVLNARQEIDIA